MFKDKIAWFCYRFYIPNLFKYGIWIYRDKNHKIYILDNPMLKTTCEDFFGEIVAGPFTSNVAGKKFFNRELSNDSI